ncbi:hypothetical protein G6F24_010666 [Rhizopus arrhizus]|nr:hypothetical protein G6F24_010666 [Rhizopus arrhizus]
MSKLVFLKEDGQRNIFDEPGHEAMDVVDEKPYPFAASAPTDQKQPEQSKDIFMDLPEKLMSKKALLALGGRSYKKIQILLLLRKKQIVKYSRSQSLRDHYLKSHEVRIKNLDFPTGSKTIIPKNCIAIDITSSSYNEQTCRHMYACPGCLFSFNSMKLLSLHIQQNHMEVPTETNVFQGNGGLMGSQSSLSSQTEKILTHKVTDEEESNVNLTDLYNECKIDERSRKIIECLNLKPFILEDEDEDKQRMICFVPDSQHVHIFKNNNKRLKLTMPSSPSISHASDCIHTPKTYSTIDKTIRTSPYFNVVKYVLALEALPILGVIAIVGWIDPCKSKRSAID